MIRSRFLASLVFVAGTANAQSRPAAAAYLPQRDTVYVETGNPHRMYWLAGGDTISFQSRDRTIERMTSRTGGGGLFVTVQRINLAADRSEERHLLEYDRRGRLLRQDSAPVGLTGDMDALVHLPARALTVGTTWVDTVEGRARRPGGDGVLSLIRTYRVEAAQDSGGSTIVRASATGTVRYRDAWWRDSLTGTYSWIDVQGPISEQFRFDSRRGLLLDRSWEMDLKGTGGRPDSLGRSDTVVAGLRSSSAHRVISRERALLVGRPLPGSDTSYTLHEGVILGHTILRTADSVASSLSRNDGLVGTVTTWFARGVPTRQVAQWTDSVGETRQTVLTLEGQALRIHQDGRTDTVVAIPAEHWAIADYAMQEHLAPLLLGLPGSEATTPIAIYRPVGEHWDLGKAAKRSLPGGAIVTVQLGDSGSQQFLLFADDGDLLYIENSDPTGAQRIPRPGSSRYALLEQWLARLRAR